MKRLIIALLMAALPLAANAQDTRLRALDRADEAKNWWAVGRVNIGARGYCTGTLIEVNVVLTAAHCFFDEHTGYRYPDAMVRFVAGYKDGSAQSIRGARKVAIDPDYNPRGGTGVVNTAHDIAVLELDQPILDSIISPMSTGGNMRPGDDVSIVSYGRGRSNRPSIQDVCTVTSRMGTVLELNCDVTFGSSGAAVMDVSGREPKVVSLISNGINYGRFRQINSPEVADALEFLLPQLSVGVQERKSVRADEGGLPEVSSGLPNTGGELQPARTGLPDTRKGLPQIGN